jgi:hypothetical protein
MKKIVFASVLALFLGACASSGKKETCACGMEKSKSACHGGECTVDKKASSSGCADCHAAEEKTGK